jgi:hypothetical protein
MVTGNITTFREMRKVYIYRTCLLMEAPDYDSPSNRELFTRQNPATLQQQTG